MNATIRLRIATPFIASAIGMFPAVSQAGEEDGSDKQNRLTPPAAVSPTQLGAPEKEAQHERWPIVVDRDKIEPDRKGQDETESQSGFDSPRGKENQPQPNDVSLLLTPPNSSLGESKLKIEDGFRERLIAAFDGDFHWLLTEEQLSKPIRVLIKRPIVQSVSVPISNEDYPSLGANSLPSTRINGASRDKGRMDSRNRSALTRVVPQTVYVNASIVVDPRSKGIKAEQIHSLLRTLLDKAIGLSSSKVGKPDQKESQDELLRTLRYQYQMRYLIDTAYLEHTVRKVEDRVSNLRRDITKRDGSMDDWVNAMSTLAEMRSNGIETMDDGPVGEQRLGGVGSYPMNRSSSFDSDLMLPPSLSNRLPSSPRSNTLSGPPLPPGAPRSDRYGE